jgi:hypothetical protein
VVTWHAEDLPRELFPQIVEMGLPAIIFGLVLVATSRLLNEWGLLETLGWKPSNPS